MSQQLPRSTTVINNILAGSVLAALSSVFSIANAAEPLQLKTSDREVYGTREIEAGQFAAGIEKLEIALARTATQRDKAAILNNLCVAHVAAQDFDSANSYCDMAVDNGYELAIAYSNRGVLNYTLGNIEAGLEDFDLATKFGHGYGVGKVNLTRALTKVASSNNS